MSGIEEDVHNLEFGEVVDLFTLDLTTIGGGLNHFTPSVEPGTGTVVYQGITYSPVDLLIDGIETSGQGVLPQPTLKIANVSRALTGQVASLDDLVGARVTRIRTLGKYLDGKPDANPNAHYPPDIFIVSQKSAQNKLYIEFVLKSALDVEGQKLPNRQVLRNYCKRSYRVYDTNTSAFVYHQCPYAGTLYFDRNGNTTTIDKDQCGKRVVDCQSRFGNDALPGWFFPGAGRFGT